MGSWKDSVPSYIRDFIKDHVGKIDNIKMYFIADSCNIIIKHCDFIICFDSSKRDNDLIEEYFKKNPNLLSISSGNITFYTDESNVINIIGFFSEQEKDMFIQKIFNLNEDWKIDKIDFLDICEEYVQCFKIRNGKLKLEMES